MNLYTYLLEFRNGTYITQVSANTVQQSMPKWINHLKAEFDEIKYLNNQSILEIEQELTEEQPILLKGKQSVWCLSFTIKQGVGLVNIVETVHSKRKYFKKEWLIELLKKQKPKSTDLILQLEKMNETQWIKQPYIRFVNSKNANQKGAQWQFDENIVLEHKTQGTIVLDILKDGRIGGFELLNELD